MAKRSRDSSIISADDSDGEQQPRAEEAESPRPAKLGAFTMTDAATKAATIHCSLPPHREPLGFSSIEDFELHYAKEHSNRCAACSRNFPTAHFLALHTDENHNTFREALQAKGEKTFACFVEGCDKTCSTPQKRRLHLIDKHLFPKIYNFRIVDNGIDKSTSMLHEGRRRRVSTATDPPLSSGHERQGSRTGLSSKKHSSVPVPPMKDESKTPTKTSAKSQDPDLQSDGNVSDIALQELEKSMSSLRFVPPSVTSKLRNKQKPC